MATKRRRRGSRLWAAAAVTATLATGIAVTANASTAEADTSTALAGVPFDREAAADWADQNWSAPSSFKADDCTWFASRALWAGGLPQTSLWDGNSYNWSLQAQHDHFPGPTVIAARANDLVDYLVDQQLATRIPIDWSDNTASGAQPGDLIAYHWNDGETQLDPDSGDLLVDHLAVVVSLNSQGYPTVAQHTTNDERYWSWDPGNATHPAGWIQSVDTIDGGQQPSAWLIHINTGPTF